MQTVNIRRDYTIDIPDYGMPWDIDQLTQAVTRSGSHFFDRDTMRSFRSRLDAYTFTAPDGWYFVTSEKHVAHTSYGSINEPRAYTVRFLTVKDNDLRLYELEGFQAYSTLNRARTAARTASRQPTQWCSVCNYRLTTDAKCAECLRRR